MKRVEPIEPKQFLRLDGIYLFVYDVSIIDDTNILIRKIPLHIPYLFTSNDIILGKLTIFENKILLTYFEIDAKSEVQKFTCHRVLIDAIKKTDIEIIKIIYLSVQLEKDNFLSQLKIYFDSCLKMFT